MKYFLLLSVLLFSWLCLAQKATQSKAKYLERPVKAYHASLYFCNSQSECDANILWAEKFREADNKAGAKCAEAAKKVEKAANYSLRKDYIDLDIFIFVQLIGGKCQFTIVTKDKKTAQMRDRSLWLGLSDIEDIEAEEKKVIAEAEQQARSSRSAAPGPDEIKLLMRKKLNGKAHHKVRKAIDELVGQIRPGSALAEQGSGQK